MQGGEIKRDEIHDCGCPAKGRRLVPGVMIVRGDRAEHRQVEVCMRIDAAGKDEFAGGVHHLGVRNLQVCSDLRDFFFVNENVGRQGLFLCNEGAVLY